MRFTKAYNTTTLTIRLLHNFDEKNMHSHCLFKKIYYI